MKTKGRYHKLPWGGGQPTLSKDLVNKLKLKNKDKVLIEYDTDTRKISIKKLKDKPKKKTPNQR